METYLIALAAVGLVLWTRGCFKFSLGDCFVGLLLATISCVGYFVIFSHTQTPWLAAMMLCPFLLSPMLFKPMRTSKWSRILPAICVVLIGGAVAAEYKFVSAGNALLVIEPYRDGRMWRFDEPRMNLKGEPFVEGASEMIDKMAATVPGAENRVRLIFSQQAFPGAQFRLDWRRAENAGNWYYCDDSKSEGWLCPALFKFFPRAPAHIYVKAEAAPLSS